MKKIRNTLLCFLVCAFAMCVGSIHAQAAVKIPSETNPFGSNFYVEDTDQSQPFFEVILPEIEKNIKENNKHSISPYYDKLPLANNPENFQGLGSTSYANINGQTVTAEAFYRVSGDSLHDPNAGMGILIYQCIQYKLAHPEEDVTITFSTYRTSATASVCVLPESKYYGYMRSLYTVNYDEHGFVRISYMLTEAARMGIKVTLVNQLNSYDVKQYNPTTGSLKNRAHLSYSTYFSKAMKTDCYNKYASGKKVSDFMTCIKVGWTVNNQSGNMQHVKSCTVSHYISTDKKEHRYGVFYTTSNLDENDYKGRNGNGWSQTGVILTNHEPIYRATINYTNLMVKYSSQEGLQYFRKLVTDMNEEQMKLILSGKANKIPADEQILYLGSETDKIFQLYFTPLGGGVDSWDTTYNPICRYVDKLAESTDYIEFAWNEYGFENNFLGKTIGEKLVKAFCENPNVKNQFSLKVYDVNVDGIKNLNLGTQIGYRSISNGKSMHAKDFLISYKEGKERHNVSIMTSCNYIMLAFHYRTNSILVIDETASTGGNFYKIIGKKYTNGMIDPVLDITPRTLTLSVGQSFNVDVEYTGKNKLTWTSSSPSIASVSNGVITAKKKGSSTITVTDGSVKATIKLKVVSCADCQSYKEGQSFNTNEQYSLSEQLKSMPVTMEASINVDKSKLTGTTTIFGNDGMFDPAIVFALNKNGQPQVTLRDKAAYSGDKVYTFNNVNAATGKKVHLSIVIDLSKNQMHCYVDGKLAQTLTGIAKITAYTGKHNYLIGGDLRNGNATYFKGLISSVAVWSDIRTESEIANDYSKDIDATDKNLLAAYDLTKCSKHMADDLSVNEIELERVVLWQNKSDVAAVGNYEYSFAVIGDTQTMCNNDPEAMNAVYDWLIENKDKQKIQYVIGLGDITDRSSDSEWKTANSAISKLNDKIPYMLTRGNHDDWDDFNRNLHNGYYEKTVDGMMVSSSISLTDKNQPGVVKNTLSNGTVQYITRQGDTPEGGKVKGDLTNSYRYFNIQGTDYLLMTLDFAPDENTLKWADSVMNAHPNHKVIIATHAYMYRDGTTIDKNDCYPPTSYDGYANAQNGDDMWKKCFSKHENLMMVLSGHDPWQHIVYRQDKGEKGNTVTQMLIDAQYVDLHGSTGMVAMFYFSDAGETLTVRYYSVEKDRYGSELSQFTVNLKEHKHNLKTTTTKATLTSNGKTTSSCPVCDYNKTATVYSPKTFKLSTTEYTYNGKERKPSVTVKDSKGNTLKEDTDYTVSYESGRKNPGKYTVTITFKGNYEGTKKLTYTIKPKVTSKITATQTTKTITLKWNKVTGATGYRVYKYNSKTKKYEKLKDVTSTTLKLSNLKAGTTYKYKVRAYTKDEDTIFGENSAVFATSTKPATPKISKVTSSKGKATVTWTNVAGESGYQVYYSTKKSSGYKKADSYKADKLKGSKSKLKSGKTYYFKVRAYKKTDSGTVYSAWSTVKSVKIK